MLHPFPPCSLVFLPLVHLRFKICIMQQLFTLCIHYVVRNILRFSSDKVSMHAAKIKISYSTTLSGNTSTGHCLHSDTWLLEDFIISPHHRRFKEIFTIFLESFIDSLDLGQYIWISGGFSCSLRWYFQGQQRYLVGVFC
jgi:hypothetical protein